MYTICRTLLLEEPQSVVNDQIWWIRIAIWWIG